MSSNTCIRGWASIAPDVFVVFGVEKRQRPNYKLWEEGQAPAFVLEVASPSTWRDDLAWKRSVYARLGVREYWQHDPTGEHLPARLQGERLTRSGYVRQPAATMPDGTLTLRSETLGLELRAAPGREMRFQDPASVLDLPSYDEEAEARVAEAAARRAAETRAAADPQVAPQVARLLSVLDGEMSLREILHALGLRDRKSLRQRYLLPALQGGYVEMTRPDAPSARNRTYRLTPLGRQARQAA